MRSFPFSRVLVTGGAGFVGSHIVDKLIENRDTNVTVFDDFSTGNVSNLARSMESRQVDVVRGDINDRDSLKKCLKDTELVFHEAAIVSVQRSISEPELTRRVNVQGTQCLLNACVDSKVKRIVIASSAAVYGDPGTPIQSENSPLSPLSPYASSKLDCEKLCQDTSRLTGLESVALRYFNIYGERSVGGAYAGVINIFADRLIANQSVIIYGDGSQTRDFVNVKDIVAANLLAATKERISGKVFNVGTGNKITIRELAELECNIITGKEDSRIIFEPPRVGDVRYSCADIALAQNELEYKPSIDLKDGLKEYISAVYPSVERQA